MFDLLAQTDVSGSVSRGTTSRNDECSAAVGLRFMSSNSAPFPSATTARTRVPKARYCAGNSRHPSPRAAPDTALLKRICTVHLGSRQTW